MITIKTIYGKLYEKIKTYKWRWYMSVSSTWIYSRLIIKIKKNPAGSDQKLSENILD